MVDTYEVLIQVLGEIVVEATLDREGVIEAIAKHGPVLLNHSGKPVTPEKIMALVIISNGAWTYKDHGIIILRSRP